MVCVMPRIVTLCVLSIFGEFHRETMIRAAIDARHEALNNMPCPQFHRTKLHESRGVDVSVRPTGRLRFGRTHDQS